MKLRPLVALLAMALAAPVFAESADTPPAVDPQGPALIPGLTGWLARGGAPQNYLMESDSAHHHAGNKSASIKSRDTADPENFGTLVQLLAADTYRGKRLRFSAYIETQNAEKGALLWARVDDAKGKVLAFDNMEAHPITGSTDWKKYDVVLDVAEQGHLIAYGVLLAGTGQAWVDDFAIEAVGTDVASTNMEFTPEQSAQMEKEEEEFKQSHPEEYERQKQGAALRAKSALMQPSNLDMED